MSEYVKPFEMEDHRAEQVPAAVDWKRILIFYAIACGISWGAAAVIYATGGLIDSPIVIPELNLPLAVLLEALIYMPAPAIAHLLTRVITGEGWKNLHLAFGPRESWRWWGIAWLATPPLVYAGAVIFFLIYPDLFDPTMGVLREQLQAVGALESLEASGLGFYTIIIIQLGMGWLTAPVINLPFIFGEEFGWRAYLQPKLEGLGGRAAVLITGALWGLWHWPIIAMGHNYGLDYPGYPYSGILMMMWFCITLGVVIGWWTMKARSVWPAVITHALVNGMAAAPAFFVAGKPMPLVGPLVPAAIGGLGFTILAAILLILPGALTPPVEETALDG